MLIDRLFSSEGCGLIDVRGTMVSWHFFLLLNDLLVSPLLVWFLESGEVGTKSEFRKPCRGWGGL